MARTTGNSWWYSPPTAEPLPVDRPRIERMLGSTRREWIALTPTDLPVLTGIDLADLATASASGRLFINGKRADLQQPLPCPVKVELFSLVGPPPPGPEALISLFEDDDLIVVRKPAGLPSVPPRDRPGHSVKDYLETKYGPQVHIPSRLDTGVSGVMAAAKSARCADPLQQLFARGGVEKQYRAIVSPRPSWGAISVRTYIARHPEWGMLRMVSRATEGKAAWSEFSVSKDVDGATEVSARIFTGRTHQIRLHLAWLGHPIVGDDFYGGAVGERLELRAVRVSFLHPLNQNTTVDVSDES